MKHTVKLVMLTIIILSFTESSSGRKSSDHSRPDVYSVPIFGVNGFTIESSGSIIVSNKNTKATTDMGVLDVKATITVPEKDIRIYNNGKEYPAIVSGDSVKGKVILVGGVNYVCIIIYRNGIRYARSIGTLITSSLRVSALRFELLWSGKGDLDLHCDDGNGKVHCAYNNKVVERDGWDMQLDVDNTIKKGPENIRIYSAKQHTKIRCYVNYYSGSTEQHVTVRLYRDGNLTSEYKQTLSPSLINSANGFNKKSWVIKEYDW